MGYLFQSTPKIINMIFIAPFENNDNIIKEECYHYDGKEVEMKVNLQENGQGFLEYGLIIIIVAVLVIVMLAIFGDRVGLIFSNVIDAI